MLPFLLYFNVIIFRCEHFYNFMLSLLDGIILGIIFVTVFVFLAPLHFILVENVIHSFFGCAYLPILREDKTCSVSLKKDIELQKYFTWRAKKLSNCPMYRKIIVPLTLLYELHNKRVPSGGLVVFLNLSPCCCNFWEISNYWFFPRARTINLFSLIEGRGVGGRGGQIFLKPTQTGKGAEGEGDKNDK
jgi:hypothetical protein